MQKGRSDAAFLFTGAVTQYRSGAFGLTWYNADMVKTLELAIQELANLSEADQEQIGLRLLSHVEKLRELRTDIDKGLRSLDAGEGKPLDIEEFIKQSNASHVRS